MSCPSLRSADCGGFWRYIRRRYTASSDIGDAARWNWRHGQDAPQRPRGRPLSGWRNTPQAVLIMHLVRALRCAVSLEHIITSISAKSVHRSGLSGQIVKAGDVIEVLCVYPTRTSSHYPFVLQVSRTDITEYSKAFSGLAMWWVVVFASVTRGTSSQETFSRSDHALHIPCAEAALISRPARISDPQ